jgi:hypothetical protein
VRELIYVYLLFVLPYLERGSWYSSVSVAAGYRLDGRGTGFDSRRGKTFVSVRNVLCPALLSDRYIEVYFGGESGRAVNLTTDLRLLPRLIIRGSTHPLPLRLHGLVLT